MGPKTCLRWSGVYLVAAVLISTACGAGPAGSLTRTAITTRTAVTTRTVEPPGVLPSQARVAGGRYLTAVALDGETLTLVPAPMTVQSALSQVRARLLFDSDEIAGTGSDTSYRRAVITGTGRTVLECDSRGSPVCGGPITGPSVKPGMQHLSLPWRVESVTANDVTIEYQAPACASIRPGGPAVGSSSDGEVTTIEVDLYARYDTVTCPPAWHSWPIGPVPVPTDLVHAPTGPIETGMTPGGSAVDSRSA